MQLSTEDMKRLMTGGASVYRDREGQPSGVEYWVQAYLGACLWLETRENGTAPSAPEEKIPKPASPALQQAFQQWMEKPASWDERELALLCKAYQVQMPANYIAEVIYHPRQRQHIPDAVLVQAQQVLKAMGDTLPQARVFASDLSETEWLDLSPLDRKLACRFRWLTSESVDWVDWLLKSSAKEQFEIVMENIYHSPDPTPRILYNLGRTKSQKLRGALQVLAWKHPQALENDEPAEWLISPEEITNKKTEPSELKWPHPPLISKTLSPRECLQVWLPLSFQTEDSESDDSDLVVHAAYFHSDKKQLENIWPQISPAEEAMPLYRAAARLLPTEFFLKTYARLSANTNFPPDQIDLVCKWLYASDVFVPAEQSPQLWTLMEDWAEMPEAEENTSLLGQMTERLSNRLHPSALSNVEKDPFDFFDAPVKTQWEDQLKKRRSLYQTLAKWQKNN